MARDPSRDPRVAPQVDQPYTLSSELASDMAHWRNMRKGKTWKGIATARDARMGYDPRAGLASLFPDYGPKEAGLTPAEKSAGAGDLARTRAGLAGAQIAPRTSTAAKSQLKLMDDKFMKLAGQQLTANAGVSSSKVGAWTGQFNAAQASIDALRSGMPKASNAPNVIRVGTDDIVEKIKTAAGKEGLGFASDAFLALGNLLSNLQPRDLYAALELISEETGQPTSFIMKGLAQNNSPQLNFALANMNDVFDTDQGTLERLEGEKRAAQKRLENAGAWSDAGGIMDDYFGLREEMYDEIGKGADADPEKLEVMWKQLNFLTGNFGVALGVEVKEEGPVEPVEDPDKARAGSDLDKAWEMLDHEDGRDALQRMYDEITESDKFKEYKDIRGYTDDRHAFDQLRKESRGYEKTTGKSHRAIRRANLIIGAEGTATDAQKNAAKVVEAATGGSNYGDRTRAHDRATGKRDALAAAQADIDLGRDSGTLADSVEYGSGTGAEAGAVLPEAAGDPEDPTSFGESTAVPMPDSGIEDVSSDSMGSLYSEERRKALLQGLA